MISPASKFQVRHVRGYTSRRLLGLMAIALAATVGTVMQVVAARPAATPTSGIPTAANSGSSRIRSEGRVAAYPGQDVIISSEVAGLITTVTVTEKQLVHRGQVLAQLRADDLANQLSEIKAQNSSAKADAEFRKLALARQEKTYSSGAATALDEVDRARRDYLVAAARVRETEAAAERIASEIAKRVIVSPIDGALVSRRTHPGETVAAGASLFRVAALSNLRVEAEVDEADAAQLAVGAPVRVTAEGYPGSWNGSVEEVPDALEPRRLKPDDPARPSDIRVLIVKIALPSGFPLRLGQRVETEIMPTTATQVSESGRR